MISPDPSTIKKIHIFPHNEKGDGNAWMMCTMYEGSDGFHIVYGETIEECFAQAFSQTELDDMEDLDVFA